MITTKSENMSRNTDKSSIIINTKDAENMLQDFTKEEAGEIFMALLAYANRGEEFKPTTGRCVSCSERYKPTSTGTTKSTKRNASATDRLPWSEKEEKGGTRKGQKRRARTYTNVHEREQT